MSQPIQRPIWLWCNKWLICVIYKSACLHVLQKISLILAKWSPPNFGTCLCKQYNYVTYVMKEPDGLLKGP